MMAPRFPAPRKAGSPDDSVLPCAHRSRASAASKPSVPHTAFTEPPGCDPFRGSVAAAASRAELSDSWLRTLSDGIGWDARCGPPGAARSGSAQSFRCVQLSSSVGGRRGRRSARRAQEMGMQSRRFPAPQLMVLTSRCQKTGLAQPIVRVAGILLECGPQQLVRSFRSHSKPPFQGRRRAVTSGSGEPNRLQASYTAACQCARIIKTNSCRRHGS